MKTYNIIVRWINDTPWYLKGTERDIKRFNSNPNVTLVEVLSQKGE